MGFFVFVDMAANLIEIIYIIEKLGFDY